MKIIIFYFAVFLSISFTHNLYSQDDIKNYRQPDVSEGSSLLISSSPYYENFRENLDNYTYNSIHVNLGTNFIKWKFTPDYNYAFTVSSSSYIDRTSLYGALNTGDNPTVTITNTNFNANITGGTSYYLIKDKLYTGIYLNSQNEFSNRYRPHYNETVSPNIGYGKMVNAFIISETSNFENVLLKEKFINHKLSTEDKAFLNALLDKRNNTEFITKYKDNSEIEFFTALEDALLNKGIINKPLNARTTMELYQSITNGNFIYFPRFRGFQIQAELQQSLVQERYSTSNTAYPAVLTLSSIYGLPVNMKLGLVGSAFLSFPLNNNYTSRYDFSFHSPLVIQDLNQLKKFTGSFIPERNSLKYSAKYSYKAAAVVSAYYYINDKAGILSSAEYVFGKIKDLNNADYYITISSEIIYNILAKLQLYSMVGFRKDYYHDYSFNFSSGISYYIF